MTTATKAIAGLGGLLATATVPSAYLAISSSSSKDEETNKVDNRKTGTEWLSSRGHKPNKPTFKNQDSLGHGCAENLFSDNKETPDPATDTKLYGCAVMSMDLGNTGLKFANSYDPKWIQFNSEITIRKGIEGWIINASIDNWSSASSTSFGYVLTEYKYESNEWKQVGNPKLWMDPAIMAGDPSILPAGEGDASTTIHIHNKKLMIKSPETTWFSGSDWISQSQDPKSRIKEQVKTKNWSGVWIDDEKQESNSWIFKDIELYVGEKKYSQVFCREEGCFQSTSPHGGSIKNLDKLDTWSNATTTGNYATEKIKDIAATVKGIIDKLKDSKGSWKKIEDICESKVDESPDEERQQQLRMYCSKGKESN